MKFHFIDGKKQTMNKDHQQCLLSITVTSINGRDGVSNDQPHDCLLNRLFRQIKENIKAPRHWPLCGEFTGHRWIPCTKGQ